MPHFYCQMVDYDDAEHWAAISNYHAEGAAREYAEACDNRSAGELLQDSRDRQIVLVKEREGGAVKRFEISIDYSKDYYARELDDASHRSSSRDDKR